MPRKNSKKSDDERPEQEEPGATATEQVEEQVSATVHFFRYLRTFIVSTKIPIPCRPRARAETRAGCGVDNPSYTFR